MNKSLQINIGERRAAHDLMMATAAQNGVDAIEVAEPNRALCEALDNWHIDASDNFYPWKDVFELKLNSSKIIQHL